MAIKDEQKADTLNKHYHQVFTKEDDTDTPTLEPRDVEDTPTTIVIQKDEVLKKLKALNISIAASPYNIHTRILEETQLEIVSIKGRMWCLTSVFVIFNGLVDMEGKRMLSTRYCH